MTRFVSYLSEIQKKDNVDIDTELEFKYAEAICIDRINRR